MNKTTRRCFLQGLGLAVGGGLAWGAPQLLADNSVTRCNVLFILVDDLGWKDLGCYGSTFYDTPNIDKLASEGMLFTDAYATCPVCSPTRHSIMSGKYPARSGCTYINHPMALSEVTIAEALKAAGYATFFAGKWHLGHPDKLWPEHQGFDINKGGYGAGSPPGYFSPYRNPRLDDGPIKPKREHLPDRLATETCKFIAEHKDQPFFADLSFYSVHGPFQARRDLGQKYNKRRQCLPPDEWGTDGDMSVRMSQSKASYAAMVEAMDLAVGKVLRQLDVLGLTQNTAVFLTSDNGGIAVLAKPQQRWMPTSNQPLRGGKGWLYEGGVREPLIVRWPGVTKPGSVCDAPVTSTDYYPTFLDAASCPAMPEQHVDGESIMPLLRQTGKLKRKAIFWHYPHHNFALGGGPSGAVRMGNYKLIEFYEDMRVELYDLKADIGEKHNLAASMPTKVNELRDMLHRWREECDAKMPKPKRDKEKN